MTTPPPAQTRLTHAAEYATFLLRMTEHVFPGKHYTELSNDQRLLVVTAADQLLLHARWHVESAAFATLFATVGGQEPPAPGGTVLGDVLKAGEPPAAEQPGGYL